MDKIRKLIRETIENEVISEAAVTFADMYSHENIGLVVGKGSVTIYDFQTSRVYGYMSYKPATAHINQFVAVAAEKGYGPLIYEAAIMSSFNKGLLPPRDGDIRGDAFEVWRKFTLRSDIVKTVLEPEDEGYSEEYLEIDEDPDNPKESIIGNTVLVKIPSTGYKDLIKRGEELMNKYKIYAEEVVQRGGNYFSFRYADT